VVVVAVLSRQPWLQALPPLAVTVPGVYAAYLALPRQARWRGRRAAAWDPVALGVHEVTGGGSLPVYIRRPHDDLLDALLDPAVAASRLVVVRGGSSTGKSRAAFEAVARGRLARWRMEYPRGDGDLGVLVDGGIPPRTIVWLAELRDYTAGPDGGTAVLGRLARLLEDQDHVVAVTTMWPEHWDSYISQARTRAGLSQDPVGTAGRILTRLPSLTGHDPAIIDPARGGIIDIPAAFTDAEVTTAVRTDPRLADAAAAASHAGQNGQLAQYLAGVPDLLDRYQGPGGNRYGQVVITAAMDAARLGCRNPLTSAFLTRAAAGYLTSQERTLDASAWAGPAMAWATEKLKGTFQAVEPVPPPRGTGTAGYRPADYLDQHGNGTRAHEIGPAELWTALTSHVTDTADLVRLADTSERYGLYRYAAALMTQAAVYGDAYAAATLLSLLRRASPDDVPRAARWVAANTNLDNPRSVALVLESLSEAGADEAVAVLLARGPAVSVSLDDAWYVASLLAKLRTAGARDAAAVLAGRAAAHADLVEPRGVAYLLDVLSEAGASDDAAVLLARAPAAHVSLDDPSSVAGLLTALAEAGASDAVTALADRAAAHIILGASTSAAHLLTALFEAGASDDAVALVARTSLDDPELAAFIVDVLHNTGASDAAAATADRAAEQVILDDPWSVALLLTTLRIAGTNDAVDVLAARAITHAALHDPEAVGHLLMALFEAGVNDAALAGRAAAHASLDDPRGVAYLLEWLRTAEMSDAVDALLARDPAAHASLDRPESVAHLLNALRAAGASDAVDALLARNPAVHVGLDDPRSIARLLRELRRSEASDAADILVTRATAHISLDAPGAITYLLQWLRTAGTTDAAAILASRATAHISLDEPGAVAHLLDALRAAGASHEADILAARAAAHISLDNPWLVTRLLNTLREAGAGEAADILATRAISAGISNSFLQDPDLTSSTWQGREPDFSPAQWTWQEPKTRGHRPHRPESAAAD
jgi:uncharacterized protein YidB (DUF937 family)